MRYTTVIDISEFPTIYRNLNARLLYLHLVLMAGYHDDDRDICDISIRRLADASGLTLSATRHALHILERAALISYQGNLILVKKFVQERTISKRSKSKKDEQQAMLLKAREEQQKALEKQIAERNLEEKRLKEKGVTSFIVFFEKRYQDYLNGDATAVASIRRNKKMYLEQCAYVKHQPIEMQI